MYKTTKCFKLIINFSGSTTNTETVNGLGIYILKFCFVAVMPVRFPTLKFQIKSNYYLRIMFRIRNPFH
jgi:hypothetical protein